MVKPMKISKTARWILTIGILVILLGGLGLNYARQKTEQGELNASIAQAQQDFIKYTREHPEQQYTAQKEDLQTRLNQANSRIAALQGEFESPTESIEINDALFEAADEANVTITKLTSSSPKEEDIKGITYHAFTLSITAKGEVVALLNLVDKVSQRFSTSEISSVKIDVPEEEEEEGESKEKPTIVLGLKIYAYESE